jgi:hypothetical protein
MAVSMSGNFFILKLLESVESFSQGDSWSESVLREGIRPYPDDYALYSETSAELRPLAQLFVALEFKSSKYYKYSCGLNFRAPQFDLKFLVLQRSHSVCTGNLTGLLLSLI